MGQVVFTLPKPSKAKSAQPIITEGYRANQHCNGRAKNPYESGSRKAEWWDQGWCEFELSGLPPDRRESLERRLAGGND